MEIQKRDRRTHIRFYLSFASKSQKAKTPMAVRHFKRKPVSQKASYGLKKKAPA
jgi:hypothetical protein